MELAGPSEVGQAFQQIAKLAATNEAFNEAIQENSKKISAAESKLKDYRCSFCKVRRKGDETAARVTECRAKEEKFEDGLA